MSKIRRKTSWFRLWFARRDAFKYMVKKGWIQGGVYVNGEYAGQIKTGIPIITVSNEDDDGEVQTYG